MNIKTFFILSFLFHFILYFLKRLVYSFQILPSVKFNEGILKFH